MTNIEIIYEDNDVCVVEKPSGLVVNDSNSTDGSTIQSWFNKEYSIFNDQYSIESEFFRKGGIVHRLDKDASGVLVLAKNENAYNFIKKQFVEREVEKRYLVLVHGKMKESQGVISTPIERNPNKKTRFFVGSDLTKTAITFWKVLDLNEQFTFLEIKIMTGRTHQIRVHMKHLGHPIVSDPLYGFAKTWKEDLNFCPRLFLHAERLGLKLPQTNEVKTFICELPDDLIGTLKSIFGRVSL